MFQRARIVLIVSLLAGASSVSAEEPRVIDAQSALRRLGVVTHLDYRGTPYENLGQVRGALRYIGLDTLRDMTPLANKRPYETLASEGFRFNFVIRRETVDELPKVVASLEDFARRHPGSIVSIEGLNEIKFWPASYRGDKSFAGAAAAQCELFRLVNAASSLRELPVIALTLGGAGQRDHDRLGDLSECADVGNAHIYFGAKPPASSWKFARELARHATARKPSIAVTETGYATIDDDKGVPEDIQAKYLLFLVARALRDDVPLTFIYQLVDDRDRPEWSYHLGLYRHDWTPKPAAHAIHHLTRLLRGDETREQRVRNPSFTLGGDTQGIESLALRRVDGSLAILVWREADLWDPVARREVPPARSQLSLTTDSRDVEIVDPVSGEIARPRAAKTPRNAPIDFTLVDRPLVLLLR